MSDNPQLGDLLAQALKAFAALTPEQQAAHLVAQRESFAAGNLAIDRDPDSRRSVGPYRAVPCGCGDPTCSHWHIAANGQRGVRFTETQARVVADLLNHGTPHRRLDQETVNTLAIDPWYSVLNLWVHGARRIREMTPVGAYAAVMPPNRQYPSASDITRVDRIMASLGYDKVNRSPGRYVYEPRRTP